MDDYIAIPTRDELIRRAEALVPTLRQRAGACETLRRCPEDTIADLAAAGLLRITQPARFGGYELGWDVLCEVGQTLARGCGSQAWVQSVFSDHMHLLSGFALEAQQEVWGKNRAALICAAFNPTGKARQVAGGVLFSGRHGFASGIDHAEWALCGGAIFADEKPRTRCLFLVPMSEARIIDDWHVMGLAGTGSKSFEVEETFVPDHRILSYQQMEEATGPGMQLDLAPRFKMPHGGLAASAFAAIAVGIAEGFLAECFGYTKGRVARGTKIAEMQGSQIAAAAAEAEVEAASLMYLGPVKEAIAALERGEAIGPRERMRAKRNAAFACRLALQAVERAFNAAGSRAIFLGQALQRPFRDIHAAAAHASVVWDVSMADYGRHLLGQDGG